MEGCYVGNGERMNFNNMSQFPTSDPMVWNIDEEALDELYGMLTAADASQHNNQLNHIPQMQDPNFNTNLPAMNKLKHFDGYKPQFPLATNQAVSMPVLPTLDHAMEYNQIPNSPPDLHLQPTSQKQQQQSNGYQHSSRYPLNKAMCNLTPQNVPPSINIAPVNNSSPYAPMADSTLVTFVDLKTFYEKGQCRLQGKSEQRLDYASSFVRIYLENPSNIQAKSAFVERSPDAAHILKDNVGQVPLKILPDESDHWMKVNLDDAGSEVYKLSKVKGEERNLFRIGVKLLLKDTNQSKVFYSDSFQVKSKPKSTDGVCEDEKPMVKLEPELKKRPVKRPRNEDPEMMLPSPQSIGSSVFPEVITDHLEATTANIKQLKVIQPIQTVRGDVAYHFKLNGCPKNIKLEEGDLIGFFENGCNGKTEIRRLTCENSPYAKLAGVISRSAWLEGKTPGDDDKDPTDVVCVIGIVNVKVRGPVQNGERIYASLSSYPGVAMPEHVIVPVTSQKLTLIGQSLESTKCSSPDAVNLVSCFVSILLSIQTQHTNRALSEMRSDLLDNVDGKIKQAKKSLLRGLKWKLLALLIFLSLLGVLLYQVYAPLTAFRYWRCSMGSIDDSTSSFVFTTKNYQVPKVNGIEFHFDDLMDKLDENYQKKSNDSSYRYYLNIDRCAAGGLKHGIRGPQFYVIGKECNAAFYYFGGTYRKYATGRNFLCSFSQSGCSDCSTDERVRPEKFLMPSFNRSRERSNILSFQNHMHSCADFFKDSKTGNNQTYNDTVGTKCMRGIKKKTRVASFKYVSPSLKKEVLADGIEVTLDELQRKFQRPIKKPSKFKGEVRYFYNFKRCARKAFGPRFFAVTGRCNKSYYYSNRYKIWKVYSSGRDVRCTILC